MDDNKKQSKRRDTTRGKMGRPPVDEPLVYVSCGVTPAVRDALVEYAWAHKKRVGEVIRELINERFAKQ